MISSRRTSYLTLAAILLTVIASTSAFAEVILNVDTIVDDPALSACFDGSPDDCSLRGAITNANNVGPAEAVTIYLPNGNYALTVDGIGEDNNQTGDLDIVRSLTLVGSNTVLTDIDGGGVGAFSDRLLEVHGSGTIFTAKDLTFKQSVPPTDLHAVTAGPATSVRLERVYIESCGSTGNGGGGLMVDVGANATINGSRFWFNAGLNGAGVKVRDGSILASGSTFRNNVATNHGGAIAVLDGLVATVDTVHFERCTIHDNDASRGGAVWAGTGSEINLVESELRNNEARFGLSQFGGAIYSKAEVVIVASTISGGTADAGIAVFLDNVDGTIPHLDITNSTISGAASDSGAAAIHAMGATGELLHVTAANNALDFYASQSSFQMGGSVFETGCLPVIGTILVSNGANIGLDSSCWGGLFEAGDAVVADLMIEPLEIQGGSTPTHRPMTGSPLIDTGDGPCLGDDQRNFPRPNIGCDSGSVERVPAGDIFFDDFETGSGVQWSTMVP